MSAGRTGWKPMFHLEGRHLHSDWQIFGRAASLAHMRFGIATGAVAFLACGTHALHEELEATQNEVKTSMQSHRDQDLVILVSLGGWIRGTQAVSAAVIKNYDEQSAKVLRLPAVVSFIHTKINDISMDLRSEPLVKSVNEQLTAVEKMVAFQPGKGPSLDEVKKLNEAVTKLMEEIQSKGDAK